MSQGYIDPTTGQYVKVAGNMSVNNTPVATEETNGLMSCQDKLRLNATYTKKDIAPKEVIDSLFAEG